MKLTHQTTVRKDKLALEILQSSQNETSLHLDPVHKRWEEAIFHENHMNPRSYHSAVIYKNTLYVYGGYEYNYGIMNDFYSIDLDSKEPFVWKKIEKKIGDYPEPLNRHTAVLYQNKMYIYGGKTSVIENSQKLYSYDFENNSWCEETNFTSKNELPFYIDSHNAQVYDDGNTAEMIVFGGFLRKLSKYSNHIFAYDFKNKEWKFYFKTESKKNPKGDVKKVPKKRANSSMSIVKNNVYIFGGAKGCIKMNDLWKFDLKSCQWNEIAYEKSTIPEPRSGHLFIAITDEIFLLFGGIHDIAHEKNDILCFIEPKNHWMKIEEDSMKNLSESLEQSFSKKIQTVNKTTEKQHEFIKENTEKKRINARHKQNPSLYFIRSAKKNRSVESKRKLSTLEKEFDKASGSKSPLEMKAARIKKEKNLKKMLLLSQFEVDEQEKEQLIINSPTTEAMKNSIFAIKADPKNLNPDLKFKNNKEKSQNSMLINTGQNTMRGKKACARDGCSGNLFNDKLVIFGGDRHLMAFHDLYFLNINQII